MAEGDVIAALRRIRDVATDVNEATKALSLACEDASETQRDGISLLHAKSATLMRYNLNLTRLALARLRGLPVVSLAEALVRDWVALNRMRPLEKKLQHHIDVLLNASADGKARQEGDNADGAYYRPDPSALVADEEEASDRDVGGADGKYRPPRISEVVYDASAAQKRERAERQKERFQRRAARSDGVRELVAELKGLPEEIRDSATGLNPSTTPQMQRLFREDAERRKYEEENFTRLTVSKKDRKRRRDLERAVHDRPLMDKSDEFAALSTVADRVLGGKRRKRQDRRDGDVHNDDESDDERVKREKLDQLLGQH